MCKRIPFKRFVIDELFSGPNELVIDIKWQGSMVTEWYYIDRNKAGEWVGERQREGHKRTPICREFTEQLIVWARLNGWGHG